MRLDLTGHPFRVEYDRIVRRAKWRTFAGYAVISLLWVGAMWTILWWIG
jgi:hypothetical protein